MAFYGKVPKIYTSLDGISLQVTNYVGNRHKGFRTREDAEEAYSHFLAEHSIYYEPSKIVGHSIPKIKEHGAPKIEGLMAKQVGSRTSSSSDW
jgi:viroplasmin and RNaseH domain-containing protein